MVLTDFGSPQVFELQDLPKPTIGVNEVLVRVYATSINPIDLKIREAGSWAVKPPAVIGYDVSGVIEAVGKGVYDLLPGEEVFYTPEIGPNGSYADFHVASDLIVAKKPINISHVEAASIPLAGGTAWDALITWAKLRPAESVLIHGDGGVGSLAAQIAKIAGAKVFAVCNGYMVNQLREFGVDRPIDYQSENFIDVIERETNGAGVDVVLDTLGGDTLSKSIAVTKNFGRMVSIVSNQSDLSKAGRKNITVHFMFLQRARYKLNSLRKLIERQQLKPIIDRVLPLEKVAEAHQLLESGGIKGKIVLQVEKEV